MHVHFEEQLPASCPNEDDLDVDGDDILTTAEGIPAYGPVQIALTTDGDATPDSGLALDRFPVATADGLLTYERSIEIEESMLPMLVGEMTVAVVVHGQDFDDSGAYDGDAVSSLDPSVPLEATVPVACAVVQLK